MDMKIRNFDDQISLSIFWHEHISESDIFVHYPRQFQLVNESNLSQQQSSFQPPRRAFIHDVASSLGSSLGQKNTQSA